jgi:hypothetical protein
MSGYTNGLALKNGVPRPTCVLLSDAGPESEEIRRLLRKGGLPFTEVSTNSPGREGIHAPRLYTPRGTLANVNVIRSWIEHQAHKHGG